MVSWLAWDVACGKGSGLSQRRFPWQAVQMDRIAVNAACAALPGAEVSDPFGGGHDCWKVGGKIFALIGGEGRGVSLKCPDTDTAALLIELGVGERAPYLHRSWVLIPFDGDVGEMRHRILASYDLIRSKLAKRTRDGLPSRPTDAP